MKALKQDQEARKYLQAIVAEKYHQPHLGTYYQALAEKALGNDAEYRKLLDELEKQAAKYTSGGFRVSRPPADGRPLPDVARSR